MAIKVENKFVCIFCGKKFPTAIACDIHKDEHNIVYVPIEFEDLQRLRQFLYFKDEKLLTETLVKTIIKYSESSAKRKMIEDSETNE